MIASYLRDIGAERATIVELGAGHGRFAYLCASHLHEILNGQTKDGLSPIHWRYVLTDVAERNIQYWQEHEAFATLRETKHIDFARFEAGVDRSIRTTLSDEEISDLHKQENVIVIANYFFDSLPMDVWQVNDSGLFACCPRVVVDNEYLHLRKDDPAILEKVHLDWDFTPAASMPYPHEDRAQLVRDLSEEIGKGTFTIPIGSLDTIETIQSWCSGPMMVLAADKGYIDPIGYQGRGVPTMIQHGCFSFNVNFVALQRWIETKGGCSYLPELQHDLIETVAYVTKGQKRELPGLTNEAASMIQFSPDDFHQVARRSDEVEMELGAMLSMIKLSCYEPMVLHRLRRNIRAKLGRANYQELEVLRDILRRTYANFYQLDDCDIPFTIGLIYQRINDCEQAIQCYRESLRLFGEQAITLLNLALCFEYIGRIDDALNHIERCLNIDPTNSEASELRKTILEKRHSNA